MSYKRHISVTMVKAESYIVEGCDTKGQNIVIHMPKPYDVLFDNGPLSEQPHAGKAPEKSASQPINARTLSSNSQDPPSLDAFWVSVVLCHARKDSTLLSSIPPSYSSLNLSRLLVLRSISPTP